MVFPDIGPGATVEFTIEDEARMAFRVTCPDDRRDKSESINFSRGLAVVVTLTEQGLEVDYDHGI